MSNTLKTILFLGFLTGILLGVGSLFGYYGLLIGLIFALLMNVFSYYFSDKIVLWMYGAKEAKKSEYPQLYDCVKDITHKAKIPMPKLYVMKSATPNAFATGRNPKHAAIAVTTSIGSIGFTVTNINIVVIATVPCRLTRSTIRSW